MKFSKEEIDLCKQIAEKYEEKIKKGSWFIYEDSDRRTGWTNPTLNDRDYEPNYGYGKNVLLWTISDCLEFLKEKNYEITLNHFHHYDGWKTQIWNQLSTQAFYSSFDYEYNNETPLEALLKAVLAVLEEQK